MDLFFLAELLEQLILTLFLFDDKRKRWKMNCARSSAEKNWPIISALICDCGLSLTNRIDAQFIELKNIFEKYIYVWILLSMKSSRLKIEFFFSFELQERVFLSKRTSIVYVVCYIITSLSSFPCTFVNSLGSIILIIIPKLAALMLFSRCHFASSILKNAMITNSRLQRSRGGGILSTVLSHFALIRIFQVFTAVDLVS